MRNKPIRETPALEEALRHITELLPASWELELVDPRSADGRADADVVLQGPGGQRVTFSVQVKRAGLSAELLLASLRDRALEADHPTLFVSDYIGPTLREALGSGQISYADATGWVRITSEDPLILLMGTGADKSPRTTDRPSAIARLDGVAASRIIRALCTWDAPLGVRELAALAEVSPGSVSKLLPTLAAEGIVDRDEHASVTGVRRRALIRRWVQDYSFTKTNGGVGYYVAPRGLDRALMSAPDSTRRATATGSAAARRMLPDEMVPVVPLRQLALYTDAPSSLAQELGMIPVDRAAANVVLAVPQDGAVLDSDTAPAALVIADLLTLPSRADAEADQLMDVLGRTDRSWRT